MTKIDDYDGYNPNYDKHQETKVEDTEEGFLETLDRVVENWRMIGLAILIAVPLAGLGIWAFETFIIKP